MKNSRITSTQNTRIKFVVQLQKKRERDRSGLMLIEGVRELSLAISSDIVVEDVFFCPDIITGDDGKLLLEKLRMKKIELTEVTRRVFGKIAYREGSGGFVGVARKLKHSLDDFIPSETPFYLVVDAVEKPGNIGAILRSADAVGLDGLIVSDPKTDLSNPNIIRASIGSVFTVPTAVAEPREAIKWLKNKEIGIISATPHGDTLYTETDFTSSCAIVVGSEDVGVSDMWLDASTERVRIPMMGMADSLNVSAAATILFYEALRQRTVTSSKR